MSYKANIEVVDYTPRPFTNANSNDLIMYVSNNTQKILLGTSNSTSTLTITSSNVGILVPAASSEALCVRSNMSLCNASGKTVISSSSSNLGIGVANPMYSLDVAGVGSFSGGIVAGGHIIPSVAGQYDLGSASNPFRSLYVGSNTIFIGGTRLSSDAQGNLQITNSNNQPVTVVSSGGSNTSQWNTVSTCNAIYITNCNVGIGTSNPQATLDVNGSIRVTGSISVPNNSIPASAISGVVTAGSSQWNTTMSCNAIYVMSSNVGIGNSNPSYPLDVTGNARITSNVILGGQYAVTVSNNGLVITNLSNSSSMTMGDKTDLVNVTSSITLATATAAKTAYDKGVDGSNAAAAASNTASNALRTAQAASNMAFPLSNIAYTNSNTAYSALSTAQAASNIAFPLSNVAFTASNTAVSASNTAYSALFTAQTASNTAFPLSNVAYTASNTANNALSIAQAASNMAFPLSNVAYTASNTASNALRTAQAASNMAFPLSNIAYTNSNTANNALSIAQAASNMAFPLSNIAYTASNTAYSALSIAQAASNMAFPLSNVAYTTSNMAYINSNVAYTSCNIAVTASNRAFSSFWNSNGAFTFSQSNVGIGTITPAYNLDVTGRTRITSNLMMGTSTDVSVNRPFSYYDSTMTLSNTRSICIGKDNTASNSVELVYTHIADGDNNNRATIGFQSGSRGLHVLTSGRVSVGSNALAFAPSFPFNVQDDVNGVSIYAAGDVVAYSDARMKTNLTKIDHALDVVCAINGYKFNRTNDPNPTDPRTYVGVIAQEVQQVLPEVVHVDDNGYLSVAYPNLVALLIEAVKELKDMVRQTLQ